MTVFKADAQVWDLGGAHSCAANITGILHCWGSNDKGQLGDGSTTDRTSLTPLPSLGTVISVALGDSHTCAVNASNSVFCWGLGDRGQLGDGTSLSRTVPVLVQGLKATAVAAGKQHTCALDTNGDLLCWGANRNGQLGDGSFVDRNSPARVARRGPWGKVIGSPGNSMCALPKGNDTRFYCWGENSNGQLGDNTTVDANVPTLSLFAINSRELTIGGQHSCTTYPSGSPTGAGRLYCWGANRRGQLGDGTREDRHAPVQVFTHNFASFSAGFETTCIEEILSFDNYFTGNRLSCWGANDRAQVGDGTRIDRAYPTEIHQAGPSGSFMYLSDVRAVITSVSHTCAISGTDSVGGIYCWGANDRGQLGDGTTVDRSKPEPVYAAFGNFLVAVPPEPAASPTALTCQAAQGTLAALCKDRFPTDTPSCVAGYAPVMPETTNVRCFPSTTAQQNCHQFIDCLAELSCTSKGTGPLFTCADTKAMLNASCAAKGIQAVCAAGELPMSLPVNVECLQNGSYDMICTEAQMRTIIACVPRASGGGGGGGLSGGVVVAIVLGVLVVGGIVAAGVYQSLCRVQQPQARGVEGMELRAARA